MIFVRSLLPFVYCRKKKKSRAQEVVDTVEKVAEKKKDPRTAAQKAHDRVKDKRVRAVSYCVVLAVEMAYFV